MTFKIDNLNVEILIPMYDYIFDVDVQEIVNTCVFLEISYKIVADVKRYNFFHRGTKHIPIVLPGVHNIRLNGYEGFTKWLAEYVSM